MSYYSERIQSKNSKGKRHRWNPEEIMYKFFQESSPSGVMAGHASFLQQWVVTVLWISSVRNSVPSVWLGASHRHPLPRMYPNSRLSGGKQVFSIHSIVYADSVVTVNHSGNAGNPPKSKFTDPSQGPIFQAGLSKDSSRPALVALFCIYHVFLDHSGIRLL